MLRNFFFQEFLSTLGINMQKKTLNAILLIYLWPKKLFPGLKIGIFFNNFSK